MTVKVTYTPGFIKPNLICFLFMNSHIGMHKILQIDQY